MKDAPKRQPAGKKSKTNPQPEIDEVKRKLEIFEEVFEWVADGQTLRDYCRQEGKPSYRTIYRWLEDNPEAMSRFTRAREVGADVIAEHALEILDEEPSLNVTQYGSSYDSAAVSWQKARAEFRLKLLAKWFPQRYGDKQTIEHEGGVQLNVVTGVPDDS